MSVWVCAFQRSKSSSRWFLAIGLGPNIQDPNIQDTGVGRQVEGGIGGGGVAGGEGGFRTGLPHAHSSYTENEPLNSVSHPGSRAGSRTPSLLHAVKVHAVKEIALGQRDHVADILRAIQECVCVCEGVCVLV